VTIMLICLLKKTDSDLAGTNLLYLLSMCTQLLEQYTLNYNLLQVSAVFGHQKVDFTTYIETNAEMETSQSR